jgi:isopropylmalate/homocitrate/citramalate synthase
VTLRDGEQAVDVAFTPAEKVVCAQALERLGVDCIQVGFAQNSFDVVHSIKAAGVNVPLELICPVFGDSWRSEVERAVDCGADVVNILMRASDPQLASLGWTRDMALRRVQEAISHALRVGAALVVFGPSFCTQADGDFLVELCSVAVAAGAKRVKVADSLGVALPSHLASLVTSVRGRVDADVGVHCHNDFGLATASTLAGWEAGATWADVSVMGVGERSGNAALEEVVMALGQLYGEKTNIHTELLIDTYSVFASVLRSPIPATKPIVGSSAFAQKLDLHVRIAADHPELFEPFPPHIVGNRRWIALGKGTGPYAIRAKLVELGVEARDAEIHELVTWVNERALATKSHVDDDELLAHMREATLRGGTR